MTINWSMAARVFIAETRGGGFSRKPDFASDLQACLTMARDWPPDVVFRIETDEPVLGKTILTRDDLPALPDS